MTKESTAQNARPEQFQFWLVDGFTPSSKQSLGQKLSRFRLVYLKRKAIRWNWLALSVTGWFIGLLILCHLPSQARAASEFDPASFRNVGAGQLMLRSNDTVSNAPHLDTHVELRVTGIVARVTVRQEFRHDGTDWVEGIYVFPLPDEAAVDRLRMQIGERIVVGEIQERERARSQYAKAKAEGRRAGLVEQERPNLFTTSVANIGPGDTIRIEIEYQQNVSYDTGVFRLRVPLTLTPRYIPGAPLGDVRPEVGWATATHEVPDAARITPPAVHASLSTHRTSIVARIDAGFPLARLESPYHAVVVEQTDGVYRVNLADKLVQLDRDFELEWSPEMGHEPGATVFTEAVDGEFYSLIMLMPPGATRSATATPRELILVIDTSGSMHGTSIEQAKMAVAHALGRLGADDRFNIIQFNSWTDQLFDKPMPANSNHLADARKFIAGLNAGGGTEMASAILTAFDTAPTPGYLRQVIFVTDGAVGNDEQLFQLIKNKISTARMFTVGIGSAPNSYFMRKAARYGRGTYTYIGDLSEVGASMQGLFVKLERPVLTDVELDWPEADMADIFPARIPDLYAGEPVLVAARMTSLPRFVNLTGSTGEGFWLRQPRLEQGRSQPGIAALWARRKIENLMDARRAGASAEAVREQVVAVGLRHHLVTRYTSLVAIDRTPVRPASEALRAAAVPNTLPRGQTGWVTTVGVPATATAGRLHLWAGGALVILTLIALRLSHRRRPRCV